MFHDNYTKDEDKDFDTTSDNKEENYNKSEAVDSAENNPLKKLRKGQKEFLELIQVSAEPKFRKLTEDQEDFLNRRGRYAPYRPMRTEVEEENEEYW